MSSFEKPKGSGGKSRRDFLKTTAAAAAGAMVGSHAAFGRKARAQEEAAPEKKAPGGPNERVNLGLIGPGGMGSAHLRAFMGLAEKGLENVKITAICDVAVPRLESNADAVDTKQENKVKRYTDYRALLDDKDVDCVLIATPEHWHTQMTIDALKAGKDVYVEKPMTLTIDDAFRILREESRVKNFVEVGTQYMTFPSVQDVRKLIAEGAIGHPTFSQTSYCRNVPGGEWLYRIDPNIVPGPNLDWDAWCGPLGKVHWDPEYYFRWRRYRKFSTGIIGDLLVHMMTPLMWCVDAGWPTRVTGTGGHYVDKAMENHDQVNITVQFQKEHTMIVAGSTVNQNGLEIVIRGNKANVNMGWWSAFKLTPEQPYIDDVDEIRKNYEGIEPHDTIRRDFLECVRTRKAPISPVYHAVKVMVIVDLATRSMWDGRAYAFDPVSMTARAI